MHCTVIYIFLTFTERNATTRAATSLNMWKLSAINAIEFVKYPTTISTKKKNAVRKSIDNSRHFSPRTWPFSRNWNKKKQSLNHKIRQYISAYSPEIKCKLLCVMSTSIQVNLVSLNISTNVHMMSFKYIVAKYIASYLDGKNTTTVNHCFAAFR